jgi:hypothetical protein
MTATAITATTETTTTAAATIATAVTAAIVAVVLQQSGQAAGPFSNTNVSALPPKKQGHNFCNGAAGGA